MVVGVGVGVGGAEVHRRVDGAVVVIVAVKVRESLRRVWVWITGVVARGLVCLVCWVEEV